ncbi:AMMECR1 domain-containing protein [Candidatus Woesearchaeota archaeon]|nr:AMMECR1 domain-containing protein [Candidatus Woesearchaeota archaeon]
MKSNSFSKHKNLILIFVLVIAIVILYIHKEKTQNNGLKLNDDDKKFLIDISRKTIEQYLKQGTRYDVENIKPSFLFDNKIFVSLYSNGRIRGSWSAQRTNLADSVIDATINALNDERFEKINSNDYLKQIDILITIIKNITKLADKDVVYLSETIGTGLEGIQINVNDTYFTLIPSLAVQQDWNAIEILQNLCVQTKMQLNCWRDKDAELYKYNTLSFIGTENKSFDTYRGSPLIKQGSINKDKIYKSIISASNWQLSVQKNDGAYEYFFNPTNGYYSKKNNIIRQALAAYSMAKAYQSTGDKDYLDSAERNINFILTHLREENNIAYLQFDNISNLGSAAVALIAMLELPNYRKYDREINLLSNLLLSMQREDGSFITYYNSNQPDDFDFYPGEAMLALVRLYEKTGDKRYLKAVEKAFPFYKGYFDRTKHEAFVMWQISTFYETYEITKKQEYADFVFEMADWIMNQQYDEKNTPYSDFLGGFSDFLGGFGGNGGMPTLSSAVYADGIADAYTLAKIVNDRNKVKKYGKSLRLASRFILQLQFDDVNTYYVPNPEKAIGAIRESLISNNLRIDYTSHSVLALLKIYNVYTEIKDTYV